MATDSAESNAARIPRLHVVTDDQVLARDDFLKTAAALLREGGGRIALHLRGPRTTGAKLWVHAEKTAELARQTGSLLAVNDRLDVALGCGAGALHLGGRSLPIRTARNLLGPSVLIGASVHDVRAATFAVAEGADYLFAGTIYPSDTHPGSPATGPEWLSELRSLGLPVIGIGGVSPAQVREVTEVDASFGVAAIRGIWNAESPVSALSAYLEQLDVAWPGVATGSE